ncbi:Deleted in malignant brain tumors 1 protein, partial [Geodia barretti]
VSCKGELSPREKEDNVTPPPETHLRIVGGNNESEGRVEILFNGTWGTICDDSWDIRDAEVVCRNLGFDSATEALSNGYFGPGGFSQPIWLDDVQCFGTEYNLTSCLTSRFGDTSHCSHYDDAGVRCHLAISGPRVRLVNGTTAGEGRVEVFHEGLWGTVCDDHWSEIDANVVCRELGFVRALSAPHRSIYGAGSGRIWLDNVRCDGTEPTIFNCSRSDWGHTHCDHSKDASAVCTAVPDNPYPVQLIDGSSANEGRLQIYYNNQWGTVCDDRWTLSDANVVCKSLGFPGADSNDFLHDFGAGSGHIWLDNVVCAGTEMFIQDCAHNDFGENNCQHSADVGVRCLPNTLEVRLVDGDNSSSGRVEVNYDNQGWGTVCDDHWGLHDADVVCRMSGHESAQSAPRGSFFGGGVGVIWFDDFICTGHEESLLDCSHSGVKVHDCNHREDASAVCSDFAVCRNFSWDHGQFRVSNQQFDRYTEGTRVDITCDNGYHPTLSVSYAICAANGQWTPHTPACSVSCPTLRSPNHGRLSTTDTDPSVSVRVVCDNGYTFDETTGDPSTVCRLTGSWSSTLGGCKEEVCPPYSQNISRNLLVYVEQGGGTAIGTVLRFSCLGNYHIHGEYTVTCLSPGVWSGPFPYCVPGENERCPALPTPTNGRLSSSNNTGGTTVRVVCNVGFTFDPTTGGDPSVTCGSDGQWNSTLGGCKQVICPPYSQNVSANVRVSVVTGRGTTLGTVLAFTCSGDNRIRGDGVISCLSSGVWNGTVPDCVCCRPRVSCSTLSVSPPLRANTTSVTEGTVVGFTCDSGYRLTGHGHLDCETSGHWSAGIPTCLKVTCPGLTTPANGRLSTGSTSAGTTVFVDCDQGYMFDPNTGHNITLCRSDGTWNATLGSCTSVSCVALPPPPNGKLSSSDTRPGTTVQVNCDDGYVFDPTTGGISVVCRVGGSWNSSLGGCKQAKCPELSKPAHGSLSTPTTTAGTKVSTECDDGYTFDSSTGDIAVVCRSNQTWSSTLGGCKEGSLNVGAVAGGAAGALVVVVLIVLAIALICWKLSSRYNKRSGYSNLRRRQPGEVVHLFRDEDEDAEEPLYSTNQTDEGPFEL